MRQLAPICLIAVTALGGCMMDMGSGGKSASTTHATKAPPATATLTSAAGVVMGTAKLMPMGDGIHLVVDAQGGTPGVHGIHIHTVGRCEAPDFTSAGPHWNPTNMKHGTNAPMGPHMGDLPNITIGADGTGHLDTMVKGSLSGGATALLDADGAAVVIHATADDYMTDPSGNSGGRIACGVINAS
jgi:Cu-Zn family superoxide dismutase